MSESRQARSPFRRHVPEEADLAVVFGYTEPRLSTCRARCAAELYKRGLVPKLLLSGGPVSTATSEAEQMAEVLVAAGVPRERLLLEPESRNTFENVERTVAMLQREGLLTDLQTVPLVSCPWHMRRGYVTARKRFPAHVRLLCCPHDEGCTESGWQESAECRARVAAERTLLARFRENGLLPDSAD
jgi:uncharacterized SAM-binding protein YcdF (DUF218 family)